MAVKTNWRPPVLNINELVRGSVADRLAAFAHRRGDDRGRAKDFPLAISARWGGNPTMDRR
jgi:hypothetical protein